MTIRTHKRWFDSVSQVPARIVLQGGGWRGHRSDHEFLPAQERALPKLNFREANFAIPLANSSPARHRSGPKGQSNRATPSLVFNTQVSAFLWNLLKVPRIRRKVNRVRNPLSLFRPSTPQICHPEQPGSRNARHAHHERDQPVLPSIHHKSGHPERSLARSVGQTQSKDPRLRAHSHKTPLSGAPREFVDEEQPGSPRRVTPAIKFAGPTGQLGAPPTPGTCFSGLGGSQRGQTDCCSWGANGNCSVAPSMSPLLAPNPRHLTKHRARSTILAIGRSPNQRGRVRLRISPQQLPLRGPNESLRAT